MQKPGCGASLCSCEAPKAEERIERKNAKTTRAGALVGEGVLIWGSACDLYRYKSTKGGGMGEW